MANVIAPNGFTVVKNINTNTEQGNIYFIPSTDTNQYQIGDAVKTVAGADANGFPAVTKSTGASGEYQRGVIMGVLPVAAVGQNPSLVGASLSLEVINVPATKTRGYYVLVQDDPATIYSIADDGLTALTAAASSKNAGFTVANPTAPLQISATVLTSSTVATTAALPLKILGLYQGYAPGGGNTFGVNARWLVKFNLHDLSASGVAGT